MSKRGQNEGSIYKREDGRWVAVVNIGFIGGKRKRKSFYGDTRKEVQEQLTTALRDQQQGLPIVTERQTLKEFLSDWIDGPAKMKIRPTTYRSYADIVRLHLIPELGHIQLIKLTPQHVQGLIKRKLEQGLSPRMVQYIHAVLRIALGKALKWGYVAQNVAKLVDAPTVNRFESQFLSPEEARNLLRAVEGNRLQSLFTVALALGLRKGEACGLRWQDIDFAKKQLTVQKNLQFIDGKFKLMDTKSVRGRRSISLPDIALQSLLEHRTRQGSERSQAGELWQEHGLVFTTAFGTPIHASNVNRAFNLILTKAGLPHIRVHDLRHTCASLLIAQGVHPRLVMEVLGHSQISLTMNTYGHIAPGLKAEVADKMQQLLSEEEHE